MLNVIDSNNSKKVRRSVKRFFSEKLCKNHRMEMGSLFKVKWKLVDLLLGAFCMREGAEFLFKIIYEIKNSGQSSSGPELILQSVSIKLLEMPRIKCPVVRNIRKI